jgi:hypothetical protein
VSLDFGITQLFKQEFSEQAASTSKSEACEVEVLTSSTIKPDLVEISE